MAGFETWLSVPGIEGWSFVMLSVISFFTSAFTAAFGLGGGVLLMAVLTAYLSPAVLIPVHGMIQLGSNVSRSFLLRQHIMRNILVPFIPGCMIGAAIGANTVVAIPTPVLQLTLGFFIFYLVWAPKRKVKEVTPTKFFLAGTVTTFLTMFIGNTGPLIAPYIERTGKERQQVVASQGACMSIQHLFKIIGFGALGFAFGPYLSLIFSMIAFGFAGTYFGRHVLNRLPDKAFRFGFRWVLTLLAGRLLYVAGRSLL